MRYLLYTITSPEGKLYLGSTKQPLATRLIQHLYDARSGRNHNPLYADMRRLGGERFIIKTLKVVNVDNKSGLLKEEIKAMAVLPKGKLYNLALEIKPTHATIAWTGAHHTREARVAIGKARRKS